MLGRILFTLLVAAAVLFAPLRAYAADDVVHLKSGGRVRGLIMEEDPKKGIRVKLGDGTVREIPAAEVDRVEYGSEAPAPAPPPPAAAPAPAPLYAPGAPGAPAYAPVPPSAPMKRRNGGLYGGGIALVCIGSVAVAAGVVVLALSATKTGLDDDISEKNPGQGAVIATIVLGTLMIGGGIPMVVIGGKRVPADEVGSSAPAFELDLVPTGTGAALVGRF